MANPIKKTEDDFNQGSERIVALVALLRRSIDEVKDWLARHSTTDQERKLAKLRGETSATTAGEYVPGDKELTKGLSQANSAAYRSLQQNKGPAEEPPSPSSGPHR